MLLLLLLDIFVDCSILDDDELFILFKLLLEFDVVELFVEEDGLESKTPLMRMGNVDDDEVDDD